MATVDPSGLAALTAALEAFAARDFDAAASEAARAAERAPASRVCREAARYLARVRDDGLRNVYVAPEAFAAFIRGGGNRALYERLSAELRAAYAERPGAALLDIGAGDGLALLPALSEAITSVTLVEPSAAMLATCAAGVAARGVRCESIGATVQAALSRLAGRRWGIAQATFSLHNLAPDERAALWPELRGVADRLMIAEFDVPRFDAALSPAHIRHVIERYERGLAEYDGDGGVVAQGFLLPVMCGYFDPTASRSTYEQPIADWIAELTAGGFASVTAHPLYEYWWAPAVLLDASASS
jgi:hypothetical protein